MWDVDRWNEFVWGAEAVPLAGPLGLGLLLAAMITGAMLRSGPWRRHPALLLLVSGLVGVPIAAWSAVELPFEFVAGTVAEAKQVNANFDAVGESVSRLEERIATLEARLATFEGAIDVQPTSVTIQRERVTVRATAELELEGTFVDVDGSGSVDVTGALVKINAGSASRPNTRVGDTVSVTCPGGGGPATCVGVIVGPGNPTTLN